MSKRKDSYQTFLELMAKTKESILRRGEYTKTLVRLQEMTGNRCMQNKGYRMQSWVSIARI